MAFSLIQSQVGSVGAANATSVTVSSTATGAGHHLIAFVSVLGTAVTITPPSGWAQVGTTQGVVSGTGSIAMFYRENSPSGVTSHVFSFSASSNAAVAFEEWSGVALSSSLDQFVAQQNAKAADTPTATTAALAGAGELAIWGAGVQAATVLTYSTITNGYVQDLSAAATSTEASRAEAFLFYNTSVGAAATSSDATASGTGGTGNTTILAVFKAAPSGTLSTRVAGLRTRVSTKRTQSAALRTRVGTRHSWNTSLRLLVRSTPAYITIGGSLVTFDESTFKLSMKLDERWRCQFTVLDYAGTTVFFYGQKVIFYDDSLGTLFSGFVATATQDKSNVYPDPTIEHNIDCIDNRHLADKRSSNRLYSVPTPAGKIVVDMLNDALSAEGVIAHYAVREDMTTAMWAQGTLTNTTATGNALTLTLAGTDFTKTEAVTADFATGTLTTVSATSNALQLTSYKAIKYSGTAGANLDNNNLYAFRKIWAGSYTLVTSDQIFVDTWIDSRSPEVKASIDMIFSDNTWMHDNVTSFQDQYVIPLTATTDLKGWADDQWMKRVCVVPASMAGKVVKAIYLDIEGEKGGDYTAYFKNIKITDSTGTITRVSGFAGADTTMHANVPASSNGYFNLKAAVTTVYEHDGNRVSPSRDITPVGIVKGSIVSWTESDTVQPTGGASSSYPAQVLIEASVDGGATYQQCTNHAPLPGLILGMNTSGRGILIRQTLSVGGPDPELTPRLTTCSFSVLSAAAATKSDFVDIDVTQTDLGTGVLTNCTSYADGLYTTGAYKNWDDLSVSGQTLFGASGAGAPEMAVAEKYLFLRTDTGLDEKARFDFAGTWQNFILEVDIHLLDTTDCNYGVVYRETFWGTANDSYAYNAFISPSHVTLAHGSNSSIGAFTSIATTAVTLTSGAWYRMKVVVTGSSHQIYLNDVLFVTATDSTYTAAGNVGVRLWNNSGVRHSGHFDNFGIVGYEADLISVSSRVTAALSLSGIVGDSRVNWQESTPSSSVMLVESTLNNGTLWETCTNGRQIPQLTSGYNAAGKSLKFRFTMTNQAVNLPTKLLGYSAFVLGQYSASGTRVSPALSLSPVGRMGNSLVTWQALLPSGSTTAKVETSPDALAWTDVTASPGGPIPGLLTQPDPTVDGFSTNTSANYNSTFGTGGSVATVTYTTTSSFLTLAGGSKALYLNSAIVVADIDVLADLDTSDSGGLAWRFVDQNNYYTLTVADNQASIGTPSRFTLTKVAGGVATQLATAAITFTRSMHHRVRVTMLAGVITASLSGVPIITYTDSSPLGAGKVGFTNNGGTLRSSQLWIAPQGDGTAGKNVYSRVTLGSTDPTVLPQMTDLEIVAYDANIGAGVAIPSADYRYTMIDRNLDDLAKQSNYAWFIDPNLLLHFSNRAAVPAPWILQSNGIGMPSSLEADSNLAVEVLGDLYRNRQVITNVTNTIVFGNNFVGDGQRSSFTLDYPIAPGTVPVITLDGQAQTVGKKGTTGSQWYYADGDATIAEDSSGAILIVSNTLAVSATGTFTDTVIVNNTAAQAALSIRAGNSGIVEAVEDATTNHPGGLLYPAAVTYATQLLTRYCVVDTSNLPTGRTLTFKTYRNGLAVGQVLPVFVHEENLSDAQLLITGIDVGMQTQPGNTALYNYVVTASELPAIGSWAKLLASGLFD